MNFNDEIKNNNTSVLVTPVSSTNYPSPSTSEVLTVVSRYFLSLYQQVKGELMKTINGKLVTHNGNKHQELGAEFDFLVNDTPNSSTSSDEIQDVRLSLDILEQRLTTLEANRMAQINQQLCQLKAKLSQRLIALTIAGAIGFISMGIWIGVKTNSSTPEVNYSNSIALQK